MTDEWWAGLVPAEPMGEAEIEARLREELKTPAMCDRFLDVLAFDAGRMEHQYRDLQQWAEVEGNESALVEAHQLIERFRGAVNESLGNVKAWKATLEQGREA